ncbi:peptide/nickel transport system substrate-binding protein [Propionibacterium cyclohexanicum]|uniref:Peptide/nickel transport system substrate-binding protein n=1 Tax=Propionibacterium cyclohexanicum TaxID=64702 RepID=A0A1H9TCY0_9ACTN|nr:ABC transporter substrate-binding protein [Propionibacterium cyclohexanicum]SER95190.1 peptide/nickel transport system substrate-binding protein [Propionibacterium cyclohexanicum]
MTNTAAPTTLSITRRGLVAMVLAGGAGMALASCSSNGGAAGAQAAGSASPVQGGTLYWGVETALPTVNPHLNGQDKATPILRNVFDSYLYRQESGEYAPWLASSYDVSSDGTTVTLTLRSAVTFSDGQPFNADAVIANFTKLTSKGYLSSIPSGLQFLTSFAKLADDKVQFTLSKPDTLFLLYLSTPASTPLSPASLTKAQTVLESGGPEVAGIGPFVITAFTPKSELDLARRPDYAWAPQALAGGEKAAYLDKVIYRTFVEGSTRTGALQQDQVQVASDIQPLDVASFSKGSGFAYEREYVGGLPYSLYLNVSKAPFDDVRVRKAFIKGFDLAPIIQSIYAGAFDQAKAPISTKGPFADPSSLSGYAVDIDAANKLLDEAGWTQRNADGLRSKDGKVLTVRAVSSSDFVRESRDQLNIAIAAALKQNVGIDYQFQIVDSGTESVRAKANDYEIFDNSYGGADPGVGLDLLYSSDPTRGFIARGKYHNPDLDALLDKGRFTNDLAARKETYKDLQKLVTDNFYVLPLYQTQDNLASVSRVGGITIDPAPGQPFGASRVWLAQ